MMTLDPIALRDAFGSFMTGVTIVTAKAEDNSPVGFTANSFTSVSMDPPLLLVCPGNHLSSSEVFRNCSHFAVNILHESQQNISNIFANSKEDRFSNIEWRPDLNGAPLIAGSLASFSCSAYQKTDAGDHLILVGKVEDFEQSDGVGLGYWKGSYFSLSKEREANVTSSATESIIAGAIVENSDRILVKEVDGKFCLPTAEILDQTKARIGIESHFKNINMPIKIGRVYSIFHDLNGATRNIYFRAFTTHASQTSLGCFEKIEKLQNAEWLYPSERTMIRRFVSERNDDQFGLYIGDSDTGEIHHEREI